MRILFPFHTVVTVCSQFKRCNLPLGSEISFFFLFLWFFFFVFTQCTRIRHLAHERSPSKSKTKIHIDIYTIRYTCTHNKQQQCKFHKEKNIQTHTQARRLICLHLILPMKWKYRQNKVVKNGRRMGSGMILGGMLEYGFLVEIENEINTEHNNHLKSIKRQKESRRWTDERRSQTHKHKQTTNKQTIQQTKSLKKKKKEKNNRKRIAFEWKILVLRWQRRIICSTIAFGVTRGASDTTISK